MKKVILPISILCFAFSSFIPINKSKANKFFNACFTESNSSKASDSTVRFSFLLNGKNGGLIDTAAIALWDSFEVMPNSIADKGASNYHVISYKCIVQRPKVALVSSGFGNEITPGVKTAAMGCSKGQLIIFYDMVVLNDQNEKIKIQNGPTFKVQ